MQEGTAQQPASVRAGLLPIAVTVYFTIGAAWVVMLFAVRFDDIPGVVVLGWLAVAIWLVRELWRGPAMPWVRSAVASTSWGFGGAWHGLVLARTTYPPPPGYHDRWHVVEVGFPVRGVVRLWEEPPSSGHIIELHGCWHRALALDASSLWLAANVFACCAIAFVLHAMIPRRFARFVQILGVLYMVMVMWGVMVFLRCSMPYSR